MKILFEQADETTGRIVRLFGSEFFDPPMMAPYVAYFVSSAGKPDDWRLPDESVMRAESFIAVRWAIHLFDEAYHGE